MVQGLMVSYRFRMGNGLARVALETTANPRVALPGVPRGVPDVVLRRARRGVLLAVASAAIALALHPMPASAASPQDAPRTLIRLTVKDSLGAPVSDASVSIVRGLRDTVLNGTTGADGMRVLAVPGGDAPVQLIIRKIGFARADRFVTVAGHDSVNVALTMKRLVQRLAAVTVTAKEDAVRKSYFIDADDIANSPRPIFDAADVLIKLRPDMIYSRAPLPYGPCPWIENLWVNGVLVYRQFQAVAPRTIGRGRAPPPVDAQVAVNDIAARRASVPGSPASGIGAARLTLLMEIKPEHIAEVSYKDCFDTSMRGNFGRNALFIVLKPGIRYEVNYGSYPTDAPRPGKRP
jgi:hypothetical protein